MNKDSKILIVGHHDVIEKSLYAYLSKNGYTNIFSSSKIGLDTTIQPAVYEFFQKGRPEYVFLGSTRSGGIEANQKNPAEFLYHNSESQNNIIYAARNFNVTKLLYFGASCMYPKEASQPIKEEYLLTGPLEPTSEPYSLAKIVGVKLCQGFKIQYNFNAISCVPPTVYGPESDTNLETAHVLGALIGKFAKAIKENQKSVTIWGSGNSRREFLFADDFAQAVIFLMERYDGSDLINIGSGEDVSIKELAQLIQEISGFKGDLIFDTSKPDGAPRKLLDTTRISQLGWKSKVSLKEGIKRTYEKYSA